MSVHFGLFSPHGLTKTLKGDEGQNMLLTQMFVRDNLTLRTTLKERNQYTDHLKPRKNAPEDRGKLGEPQLLAGRIGLKHKLVSHFICS